MSLIYSKRFSPFIRVPYIFRTKANNTADYCLNLVKTYDYENFVSLLLLKNSARSSATAIRSFNVEIAKVAEQVSQETIGLMRLHFWKETIEKCYSKDIGKVPQQPVALELFNAINRSNLSKRHFTTLLKCRTDNFKLKSFETLEEMEAYAEKSVSPVYYLILEACDVRNVHADHAASHLGKAQGIIQLLRSSSQASKLNFLPLPQNILIKHSVSHEDILRGKSNEKMQECTFEVASRAYQHLQKARNLSDSVPENARQAFLPAVTMDIFLTDLQKVHYDIFNKSLKHKSIFWMPKLWLHNFQKKY